jgi:hypothetical protein
MVTQASIEAQLKRLGVTVKGWGSSEIHELQNILMPQEEITGYAHGWYDNGFATLITTTERLLLIDKKLFHLTIEDVRYDMIAEVDFNARIMDATVRVTSVNKSLRFSSMKQRPLRALTTYMQQRVMELRQQPFSWQQFEQTPVAQEPEVTTLTPQTAISNLPLPLPLRQFNPYTKSSLTTKHQFLPKVPRRFRPA